MPSWDHEDLKGHRHAAGEDYIHRAEAITPTSEKVRPEPTESPAYPRTGETSGQRARPRHWLPPGARIEYARPFEPTPEPLVRLAPGVYVRPSAVTLLDGNETDGCTWVRAGGTVSVPKPPTEVAALLGLPVVEPGEGEAGDRVAKLERACAKLRETLSERERWAEELAFILWPPGPIHVPTSFADITREVRRLVGRAEPNAEDVKGPPEREHTGAVEGLRDAFRLDLRTTTLTPPAPKEQPGGDERGRVEARRIRKAMAHVHAMGADEAREVLAETVQAILCAVANLDEVPEDSHPADVVSKHLQRGNMSGDGVDIVPRRLPPSPQPPPEGWAVDPERPLGLVRAWAPNAVERVELHLGTISARVYRDDDGAEDADPVDVPAEPARWLLTEAARRQGGGK